MPQGGLYTAISDDIYIFINDKLGKTEDTSDKSVMPQSRPTVIFKSSEDQKSNRTITTLTTKKLGAVTFTYICTNGFNKDFHLK